MNHLSIYCQDVVRRSLTCQKNKNVIVFTQVIHNDIKVTSDSLLIHAFAYHYSSVSIRLTLT